jgi:hypothetical protein
MPLVNKELGCGMRRPKPIPIETNCPARKGKASGTSDAVMHRDGDRLVIEPLRTRGLIALLATMKPRGEDFPEIDDQPSSA